MESLLLPLVVSGWKATGVLVTSLAQSRTSGYDLVEVGSGAIKWGKRQAIAPVPPQGRSALHLVGGLCKLGMATEEDLRWLKKEFVSVWKATPAVVKSLP